MASDRSFNVSGTGTGAGADDDADNDTSTSLFNSAIHGASSRAKVVQEPPEEAPKASEPAAEDPSGSK